MDSCSARGLVVRCGAWRGGGPQEHAICVPFTSSMAQALNLETLPASCDDTNDNIFCVPCIQAAARRPPLPASSSPAPLAASRSCFSARRRLPSRRRAVLRCATLCCARCALPRCAAPPLPYTAPPRAGLRCSAPRCVVCPAILGAPAARPRSRGGGATVRAAQGSGVDGRGPVSPLGRPQ